MSNQSRFLLSGLGLVCAAPLDSLADGGQGPTWWPAMLAILAILAALLLASRHFKRLARLQAEKVSLETSLNALPDAVIQLDAAGGLNYLNPAGAAMLGNDAGTEAPWQFIDHATRSPLLDALLAQADKEGLVRIPAGARLINRHGLEMEVEGICQPLRDPDGRGDLYQLQLRDVSEESEWRQLQPDLWDRDPVSSLPGRSFMESRLNRILQNRRAADRPMTYLTISCTGIRAVYDAVGAPAGDTLVRHLTALLRAHVRDTDLVARMDEETFAVLLTFCPAEIGQRIAAKMATGLAGFRFEWEGRSHPVEARLAQVDIPPFEGGLDELLAAARP